MAENIERLIAVMAKLRDPEGGCPWDQAQTYRSIAPHTIEEAYEVVEAVENADFAALKDELGDLLFHVIYYSQMASEDGHFSFDAVAAAAADKMIRRHPHVFGDAEVADAGEQTVAWEAQKARERAAKSDPDRPAGSAGTLDGVSTALPALTRAMKLQNRAARIGFDWGAAREVIAKVREELGEIEDVIANDQGKEALIREVGDLLFSCVNLGRKLGIEPETALRHGNRKFEDRFRRMESLLAERGLQPGTATLAEMDGCWDEAKRREKAPSSEAEDD